MQWLYVRHHGGTFILRVEDTDRTRFIEDAEEKMKEALKWYGIDYDEGPEKGGEFGPYRQSERLSIYQDHAEQLLAAGHAYYCFCTAKRLEEMRRDQQSQNLSPRYDGRCRAISLPDAKSRLTEPHVVRLKFPTTGETVFTDLVRGEISFQNALIDDQVLLKSDGWPTYHLAVVVDDHLMKITTVIRGEEWLSSTPKHLVLYDMFGWTSPAFAHLPLILGADRSKLSKRHGSVEALRFRDEGYIPEAMINFLALLGWNPKTDEEFFTQQELVHRFDLANVNKAGAIFDRQKLQWMNSHYLRKLSLSELTERVRPFLLASNFIQADGETYRAADDRVISNQYLQKVVALSQERLKTFADIVEVSMFFFDTPTYEPDMLIWKKSNRADTISRLQRLLQFFATLDDISNEQSLETSAKDMIEKENLGVGDTLWPLRVALSGRTESPSPFAIAAILGKLEVEKRIHLAIGLLKT